MSNLNYEGITDSQKKGTNQSSTNLVPDRNDTISTTVHGTAFINNNNNNNTTTAHNNNTNDRTIITNSNNNNAVVNEHMHVNNEAIYTNGVYHASRISYIPPSEINGKTIKVGDKTNISSYQYAYEQELSPDNTVLPQIYKYPQMDPSVIDTNSEIHLGKPYTTKHGNIAWENNYPYTLPTEQYDKLNVQSHATGVDKTYNRNYLQEPQTTVHPPMHQTSPIQLNQPPVPSSQAQKHMTFYAPHSSVPSEEHTFVPSVQPHVSSYGPSKITSNVAASQPRYIPCKVNPISEMNPIFRKTHEHVSEYSTPLNYTSSAAFSPNNLNCGKLPLQPTQYDPTVALGPMAVMPPSSSPLPYYIVEESDDRCLLKKGIDYAVNNCKCNNGSKNFSKRKYFVRGTRGTSPGPLLPYVTFEDKKKFDMFKKLTLKVGTCLDDLVNLFVESFNTSIEVLHKGNEVKLHDLYPFYNPDPVYTRPERPTLQTGNNIIDNINNALDSTTLEKHKTIPKPNARIPIPKTEKTGHVVVDGINTILDNLLNEPLSYHKYDYYSDKVDVAKKSKRAGAVTNK